MAEGFSKTGPLHVVHAACKSGRRPPREWFGSTSDLQGGRIRSIGNRQEEALNRYGELRIPGGSGWGLSLERPGSKRPPASPSGSCGRTFEQASRRRQHRRCLQQPAPIVGSLEAPFRECRRRPESIPKQSSRRGIRPLRARPDAARGQTKRAQHPGNQHLMDERLSMNLSSP